jgi:enamine deaminase RidA (YjgF/YER057c/UK114 family)
MTDKTPVASPSAPPAGPYSPGLATGDWVFLAGQNGYERHFPEPRPVRTTVGAALPGGALVEITAIAHRPPSR